MERVSSHPAKHVVSKNIERFFTSIYDVSKFILQFFKDAVTPPYELQEIMRQCYLVGYKSLPLISVTAFISGMVFTDHSRPPLADFGATSWLPSLAGSSIIKALAPMVTALICAGKVSSQIGAELGSMKVTEQIDAMEVSGTDPFKYLIVTRVLATTFMIPLLVVYSAVVGLLGSFIDIYSKDQSAVDLFIYNAFTKVGYAEITSAMVRSVFFGFTVGIVGCYKGNNIWYSGVKIGTVDEVKMLSQSNVEVVMKIEKRYKDFIYKDAKAKIGSDGLIGNRIVILYKI